jgi:hypothetical protein
MVEDCPLCRANEEERFYYEDKWVKVLDTANKKGHKSRIMVSLREHRAIVPEWLQAHMLDALERTGSRVFSDEYKFVIMSPLNGSVPDHAHFVATDLDPSSDDFSQILATPWMRTVDVKGWDVRKSPG